MQLRLSWPAGDEIRSYLVFDDKPVTIGAGAESQIILPHETVSPRHAQIFCHDQTFYLRNLSRTGLIFVKREGGERRLAWGESSPLQPGDVVRLGAVQIALQIVRAEQPVLGQRHQVRCAGCGRTVSLALPDCPWCGASLAFSQPL